MIRPPDPVDPQATLDRAASLQNAVQSLAEQIAAVASQGQQSESRLRVMIPALIFDVLLSVGLGVVGLKAVDASRHAQTNTQAAHATCIAGNQARAANLAAWTYVLTAPDAPPQSSGVLANLQNIYAPRDCGK